jgi:tellurite resistance protein TehA-like permease
MPVGCFAVVMATGIVSVAAHQHRLGALSSVLFAVAVGTYVVLALWLLAERAGRTRPASVAPSARMDALTVVAASAVLGVRAVLGGVVGVGEAMAVVAVLAWAPLAVAAVAGVVAARGSWRRQAGGTWLLPVVATESLAVLAATLATVRPSPALAAAGLGWLALGLAGYPPLAGLVVGRLRAARARLGVLTPDSWILSGALSIATLAASRLAAVASGGPVAARARPWLTGLAVAAWVPASGLYLVLAAASAWRAARLPATRRYQLGWWAMVFPLGMYAVATDDLGQTTGSGVLLALATVAFWVALAAWLAVAAAVARHGPPALRAAAVRAGPARRVPAGGAGRPGRLGRRRPRARPSLGEMRPAVEGQWDHRPGPEQPGRLGRGRAGQGEVAAGDQRRLGGVGEQDRHLHRAGPVGDRPHHLQGGVVAADVDGRQVVGGQDEPGDLPD